MAIASPFLTMRSHRCYVLFLSKRGPVRGEGPRTGEVDKVEAAVGALASDV